MIRVEAVKTKNKNPCLGREVSSLGETERGAWQQKYQNQYSVTFKKTSRSLTMKTTKYVVLTLVGILVFAITGCHKHSDILLEAETETPSPVSPLVTTGEAEYGLKAYPNGTITIDDFKATGKMLTWEDAEVLIAKKELGETPENALVFLSFYADGHLKTPYECNYYNDFPALEPKSYLSPETLQRATDLKTFREITGLKEASAEYAELFMGYWHFDASVKFFQTRAEKEEALERIFENSREGVASTLRSDSDLRPYLKKGAILFARWPNVISVLAGHTGGLITDMPSGSEDVEYLLTRMSTIEADKDLGGVAKRSKMGSFGRNPQDWSIQNVQHRTVSVLKKGLTNHQRDKIVSFLKSHLGKRYFYPPTPELAQLDRKHDRTFYCSKLLWMAYKTQVGVDLDYNGGDWIMPEDILQSPHVYNMRF